MTNKNAYKDNAIFQKSIKNPDFIKMLVKLAKIDDERREQESK
jgi:hypothetical protein